MAQNQYVCVYFRTQAEADDLIAAFKAMKIQAVSFETVSESYADTVNRHLRAMHEHLLKVYDTTRDDETNLHVL